MTNQWIENQKQANERTASSYSGLYFGHYKAYTLIPEIVEIKFKLVNLAIKSEQPLLQQIKGVSVILEKSAGNVHVQKLRVVLLLEVDFNAMHKIIFNNRLILNIEVVNAIPIEVIRG